MDNKALINGKIIELSEEERESGANFHKNRYPFAWINNTLVFNDNANDDRDHQHWLEEDFGINKEEFETIPRGYMKDDRIQLFIGSGFKPLDTSKITVTDFQTLLHKHHEKYNSITVSIYNGVKIGKVGETWPPLVNLGEHNTV